MSNIIHHVFPSFSEQHTSFEKFGEISQESISLFQEKAASSMKVDLLLEFWREYGEGRFSDGLLYICDPVKKKSILNFFFSDRNLYPLVVSSFGRILFTDFKKVFYLSTVYGWFNYNAPNFELLFEGSLADLDFLNDALFKEFHLKCTTRLGFLEPNEIFGFEPAIALGGNDEDINMVKKFQMDAHLAFLSQLVQVEER
jgi:hypothetical protein